LSRLEPYAAKVSSTVPRGGGGRKAILSPDWIKQHLRIRSFYGRSENAVRCQIWSAICTYLMVAIIRRQLNIQKSLNEILQIVSVNIFEQTPLVELLAIQPALSEQKVCDCQSQKSFCFNDK
jgi:hypothetical protein